MPDNIVGGNPPNKIWGVNMGDGRAMNITGPKLKD